MPPLPANALPHHPPGPPERFNAAAWLLARNAAWPERCAYVDDAGALSYGELADRVRRCAAGLLALGLQREQRLLMVMHDGVDFPVAFLGALYAGIVPVPVNTLLTADDYAYLLRHSQARAVLVSAALLPVMLPVLQAALQPSLQTPTTGAAAPALRVSGEAAPALLVSGGAAALPAGATPFADRLAHPPLPEPADTAADDFAFWLYSSGSTGRPKGAVHSHANLYWTAVLYPPVLGLRPGDVLFSAAKLFFAYGLGNGLSFPLAVGATTVLMAERPTPAAVFKRWTTQGVTVFFGAPTGFAGMLAAADLPGRNAVALRLCSSAGEALPRDIGERFRRHFGCDIVDGIGSTEMLHIYISNRPGDVAYGTSGTPVPGYRVKLVDEDGAEVNGAAQPGVIGDLYVAGPSAAHLYWASRDKSTSTFQGEWTKSGDKYFVDEHGRYVYAGRSDDMLKVSGIYVSPFEVESTLAKHAAVLEAAVIGTRDADGLTKTKAFVVLKPGARATEGELKDFVKDQLAPYKYPRMIEFLDELPKTATGKIQRFRLRERERT